MKMKKATRALLLTGALLSGPASQAASHPGGPFIGPVLYCTSETVPATKASMKFCTYLLTASAACDPNFEERITKRFAKDQQGPFYVGVRLAAMYYAENNVGGSTDACLPATLHGLLNGQITTQWF